MEEMKEKDKRATEETLQKVKAAGRAAAQKLDEYYNKLPLDKINEKLGGKVDVKTKKFKIIAAAVLAVSGVMLLCLMFGGGSAPSSKEISLCKTRINKFEKEYGHGRRCIKITEIERESPATPSREAAKLFGLKHGKECERYSCTITWKDKSTSSGIFIRQGDRFGIIVHDWFR